MKLRFHLDLCNHDKKLKSACNKILDKASTGIRVYGMKKLKLLTKKLELLKQDVIKVVRTLKIKLQKKTIDKLKKKGKTVVLERNIKSRNIQKRNREQYRQL